MSHCKPFAVAITILLFACTTSRKMQKKEERQSQLSYSLVRKDSVSNGTTPKTLNEFFKGKVTKLSGIFTVYQAEQKYYLAVPDSLLGRDFLSVTRLSKAASNNRPLNGLLGYGGDLISENIIRFTKGPIDQIFISRITYNDRPSDSTRDGMYYSIENSNFQSISTSLKIQKITDCTSNIVDITELISGDNNWLFFEPKMKKIYELGAFQADKSYVVNVSTFPINVEIKTVKTYAKDDGTSTYALSTSLVLLPKYPMKPRSSDKRVGYFTQNFISFDQNSGVNEKSMILRWRLEPKEEDIEDYRMGKLVEPQKPIVYYIDPATPKKWIPYLIQGVNDWQEAFEKAGFKNAIYALEAPSNDTTWSIEDATHNVIIYKASSIPNANGPNIHDPRSGEILETHINWFHNVLKLIHDWYLIQAGPSDARARKMVFDDSLMGQLIRFVSSHEVGHTLGLMHNFGASSTIPVDSLRNKSYLEKNGFCPSIMDYARFNYVAQPEDSIPEKGLMPRLGEYDRWAIEWGYKWLPQFASEIDESLFLNKSIADHISKNSRLNFGSESSSFDPTRQSEDLGDDAMKAGHYGIKNLKRVYENLVDWTAEVDGDRSSLKELQNKVIQQYQRYITHVCTNVGGVISREIKGEQNQRSIQFVAKNKQRRAVLFLQNELFETPMWLKNDRIFALTGRSFLFDPLDFQTDILTYLTSNAILMNLLRFETNDPENAYTISDLFSDLKTGIFKELNQKSNIDLYRRNLQKTYIERLITILQIKPHGPFDGQAGYNLYTDVISIVKGQVQEIQREISGALSKYTNKMTRLHLIDLKERLQKATHENINENVGSKGENQQQNINPSLRSLDNYFGNINCLWNDESQELFY